MSRGLPKVVQAHLEKAKFSAIAAVEVYNRPGSDFRTHHYIVLITMAWTALFHAYFFKKGVKPCYRSGKGRGTRYEQLDGEPKHWELAECGRSYFQDKSPPVRKNLEFLIGLRNKIEHRHLPELDPALYGECQSALMNFEAFIVSEFGAQHALSDSLSVALQFSHAMPSERAAAIKKLASTQAKSVLDYVKRFRAALPPETLSSSEFMFSVYLVPKTANRESAADIAVEFVPFDPSKAEEMKTHEQVVALIKERQVPVLNLDTMKASDVVREVQQRIPWRFTGDSHVRAWRHFQVRPPGNSSNPERTKNQYCIYDRLHGDYAYTKAWIELLVRDLAEARQFETIVGKKPVSLVAASEKA